jgi:hypothetical protein
MRRGNALNSAIRASPRFKVREAQAESGAGGHEGRQDVVGVAVRVGAGPATRRCCLAIPAAVGLYCRSRRGRRPDS